jgi:hypothetical protein
LAARLKVDALTRTRRLGSAFQVPCHFSAACLVRAGFAGELTTRPIPVLPTESLTFSG